MRILLLLVSLVFAGTAAHSQSIVSDLSQNRVSITANFDGSQIFIFGAVKSNIMPDVNAGPLDVIIEVAGPSNETLVRKKEFKYGIWVNGEAVTVERAPVFYSLAATRPISEILSEEEQVKYGIGLENAIHTGEAGPEFAEAIIRIRQDQGVYASDIQPVKLTDETLFTTEVDLPSNLVEGDYTVKFYLVRDNAVVASSESGITVRKSGMERWIYNLAHEKPLVYGLLSLLVALVAGWTASTVFRLLKR